MARIAPLRPGEVNPRRREARHHHGGVADRESRRWQGAAIDPEIQSAGIAAKELGKRVEIAPLCRMVALAIPRHVPPHVPRHRQEPAMLARAVVIEPGLVAAGTNQGVRGVDVDRVIGAAGQRLLAQSERLEPALDQIDVHGLAQVRRAGQGEVALLEAVCPVRPGLDQRDRLNRLERRARIGDHARVAPAVDDLAVGVGHRGDAEVHAFDDRSAPHLGDLLEAHHVRAATPIRSSESIPRR